MRRAFGILATLACAAGAAPAAAAASGTITGTVTAASGRVCVYALDAGGQTVAGGPTNDDGTYILDDVPAGSWTVEFYPDHGCVNAATADALQFYAGAATRYDATPVVVADGQTTSGIDGALAPGAAITGIVRNGAGRPLPNVCVIVEDAQGRAVVRDATGQEGLYRLDNLPAGRFVVQYVADGCAGDPQAYAPQFYAGASSLDAATPVTLRAGGTTPLDDVVLQDAAPGADQTPSPAAPASPGAGAPPATGSPSAAGTTPAAGSSPVAAVARLSVVGRLGVDHRHRLRIGLRCARGTRPCRGTTRLTVSAGPGRTVVLSGRFSVPAGRSRTVSLSLKGVRGAHGRLTVTLAGARRPVLTTTLSLHPGRVRP